MNKNFIKIALCTLCSFIYSNVNSQSIYKSWFSDSVGCVHMRKDTFSDVGIEELVELKIKKNTITFIRKHGKTFLSFKLKMKFNIIKLTEDTLILSQVGINNKHCFEELSHSVIIFISNSKHCISYVIHPHLFYVILQGNWNAQFS